MRILITGFEPFGGETMNPSWEAVSRLPDEIGDYALTKLRIPVVFGKAADEAADGKGKKKSITLFYEDNEDLDELLTAICGKEFLEEI